MNKNEFIDWAYNTYRKFIDDKEAIVAYENDEKIIVLDIKTDKTFVFNLMKSPKCFTKDPIISMAVAYASLKNIEIPTIEEPKYERVKEGENYYWVGTYCGRLVAIAGTENPIDSNFDNNNYFHTKERANEVADKINFLLKLERLHEIYCPDYKPNWKDNSKKILFPIVRTVMHI